MPAPDVDLAGPPPFLRIERQPAVEERVVVAIGTAAALVRARHVERPGGRPPPPPPRRVGVGDLVVDDERAAGLEVGEHPGQPLAVLIAGDAQSEAAAAHDRAVAAGQVELVVGLGDERRRRADGGGRLAAELEHVDRHVRAVDVEPIADVGHQQATGAAGEVEGRRRGGDVAAEEVDLGPVQVEERPPARPPGRSATSSRRCAVRWLARPPRSPGPTVRRVRRSGTGGFRAGTASRRSPARPRRGRRGRRGAGGGSPPWPGRHRARRGGARWSRRSAR